MAGVENLAQKEEDKKAEEKKDDIPAKKEEDKKAEEKKEEDKKGEEKKEEKKDEIPAKKEEEKGEAKKDEEKKATEEEKKREKSCERLGGEYGQDVWCQQKTGDPLPTHPVVALGRPLKAGPGGAPVETFVALMYFHGKPIMGRAWKEEGKDTVAVSFAVNGRELSNVRSFQLLRHKEPEAHGFHYRWMPYAELREDSEGWQKVHVANVAPCVCLTEKGREMLGKMDMFREKASFGEEGKELVFQGPDVAPFLILARRNIKK